MRPNGCLLVVLMLTGGGASSGQDPAAPSNPYLPPTSVRAPQTPEDPRAAQSYEGLAVSLQIESAEELLKNEVDVEITFTHQSVRQSSGNPYLSNQPHRILNPGMSPLLPLPGELVIRDAAGKEVNRIDDRFAGSARRPQEEDYLTLPVGQSAGTKLRIAAAKNSLTNEWIGHGEFTLQFEMFPAALGAKADRNTPIVRSEPVRFTLGKLVREQPQIKPARAVNRDPQQFLDITLQLPGKTANAEVPQCQNELDVLLTYAAWADGVKTTPPEFVIRNAAGEKVNHYPRMQFFSSRIQGEYIKLPRNTFLRLPLRIDVAALEFSDKRLPDGEYTLEVAGSEQRVKFRLAQHAK